MDVFFTRQIFANLSLVPRSRIARLRWVSHVLELCFLGRTFQLWKFFSRPEGLFSNLDVLSTPWLSFIAANLFLISRSFFLLAFQLWQAFFLPCLVPLGFLVRLLSRHGGGRANVTLLQISWQAQHLVNVLKSGGSSAKVILFELCKNGFIRKTRTKSSIFNFQCIGRPSHRRWSTLAATSSGTCHSQQK